MTMLEMSIQAAMIIVIAVVIRAVGINHLPKKTFLALWLVTLCRLLIPFSISSPFSFYTLFQNSGIPVAQPSAYNPAVMQGAVADIPAALQEDAPSQAVMPLSPVLLAWLVGMGVVAAYFIASYIKSYRRFRVSLPIDSPYIAEWLREHKMVRRIEVQVSDQITSPLTYGILRPVILLPKNIDWDDKQSLDYILTHEWIHIKRFDALSKMVLAAALCIHWFNPLVWVMYILANRDLELSCDETIIKSFGIDSASSYALTLLGRQEKQNKFSLIANHFSKHAIIERINAIMKFKKTSVVAIVIAVVIIVGVTTAFATSTVQNMKSQNSSDYQQGAAEHRMEIANEETTSNTVLPDSENVLLNNLYEDLLAVFVN
jgi:bla regulator protein BlaR1